MRLINITSIVQLLPGVANLRSFSSKNAINEFFLLLLLSERIFIFFLNESWGPTQVALEHANQRSKKNNQNAAVFLNDF